MKKPIHLLFDLKKIKLTPFDYSIIECNTKDTILLQVTGDFADSILQNAEKEGVFPVIVADTDAALERWSRENVPVIAWSHGKNSNESLMASPWLILDLQALTPDYLDEIRHRFLGLPLRICQTARCYLRELSMEDLDDLMELDGENGNDSGELSKKNGSYEKNCDGRFFPLGEREAPEGKAVLEKNICADYLEKYIQHQYPFYGFGIYGAYSLENDRFLGIAGFSLLEERIPLDKVNEASESKELLPDHEDNGHRFAEIEVGYAVKKEFRRQGYAKEWILALLDYLEKEHEIARETIVARVSADNMASIKTAESCGVRVILI